MSQYSISITPENVRKPKVCRRFQEIEKWNSGLKWFKHVSTNYKSPKLTRNWILDSKTISFQHSIITHILIKKTKDAWKIKNCLSEFGNYSLQFFMTILFHYFCFTTSSFYILQIWKESVKSQPSFFHFLVFFSIS